MSSEELVCLPIAQIRLDRGTQVRAKIDEAIELRRSNADKIRAVQIVLADQEWSKKSTRWIAEVCGVGRKFVEELRIQLATVATHQEEGGATRVCQDGKRRSVRRHRQSVAGRGPIRPVQYRASRKNGRRISSSVCFPGT